MKVKKKKEKVWDTLKPPPATEPVAGKAVVTKSGETIKQYPPDVGHHGTDEERELNPEE